MARDENGKFTKGGAASSDASSAGGSAGWAMVGLAFLGGAIGAGIAVWATQRSASSAREALAVAYKDKNLEAAVTAARIDPTAVGPWTYGTLGLGVAGLLLTVGAAATGADEIAVLGAGLTASTLVAGGVTGIYVDDAHARVVALMADEWPLFKQQLSAAAATASTMQAQMRLRYALSMTR